MQEDLNIENIDILEDELHRSSNNAGIQLNIHDSSIQRYMSNSIQGQSNLGSVHQSNFGRATNSTNEMRNQNLERNLTISRMLQLYRNRRRAAMQRERASENGEVFVPRTLTQNYMNNGGSDTNNSRSPLSNLYGINVRSESDRRNFETMQMDRLVNQLRSERQEEDNNQNIENFSNSGNNNFDRTASIITRSDQRNPVRRPITRAAGYDSRQ